MIVKNEENMLHRCLKSVKPFATEIIINDTGSTDSTLDIAKQYDAKIIHGKSPLEIGFDEARNESIKHAKSDWILWLDADEEVIDHQYLLKYLRPNIFAGYSIKQHHFTVDAGETKVDTPVRLFRNGRTIRFYGFVHEHPEREGMVNEGVGASTLLGDVNIAHDGYFSERRRRGRFNRNIQLMFKEFKQNPDRLLTKFLMIRDYVHIARYELEKNQNKLTPYAIKCLQDGIDLYRSSFLDNATNYTEEATMFYSEILRMLNMGLEYRINLNVGHSNVKPDQLDSVVRFADNEEFMKYLKMKVEEKAEPHEGIFL
jgi:glycosyltransferase involved in cell wall biosynthesis